jgi:hypothetical protein
MIAKVLGFICAAALTLTIVYFGLMVCKNLSYRWWYEDMVKQTIREVVIPQAIKR